MRSILPKQSQAKHEGFTIIELLIASTVFAIIIMIITVGIINITQSYTKGITENSTQGVARNIINDISQAIQFSPGKITPVNVSTGIVEASSSPFPIDNVYPPTPGTVVYGFCVGEREYLYQLGYMLVSPSQPVYYGAEDSNNGIIVNPSGPDCPGLNQDTFPVRAHVFTYTKSPLSGFSEFLNPDMRLSYLMVCEGVITTNGGCTYEANSNLYSIGVQVSYGNNNLFISTSGTSPPETATDGSTLCRGSIGSQFCATSKLITVVEKRVI
jgi:prepilin-type N-terminal cleavage/methylation domain-containing protein